MKAALKKTVSIRTEDDVKKIAFLMDKYKYVALPVVNAENVMVGIITIDDIFNRLVTIAWRRARRRKDIR
jgi:magnesium transporter